MTKFKTTLALCLLAASMSLAAEPFTINYSASLEANAGSDAFAPYYVSALRNGRITSGKGANLDLAVWKPIDLSKRFSYAFAAEGIGRGANDISYERFNGQWVNNRRSTSNIWLHQLYGEVKFRGVFLTVGLKEFHSKLLNERLTSGDLSESANTRPIPGARAGFIDFQNIPFTKGWVQIQGEIGYYKSTDNHWQDDRYNYFNYHINQGWWYNYKNLYFRTKPSENFSVTIGMQACAQFGGYTHYYRNGQMQGTEGHGVKFRDFFDMLVPREGETYVVGNHVGNWDLHLRYRLHDGSEIKAYMQSPWEDGSGVGKLNGWDGLWGLEWKPARRGLLGGALIEFISFMNQSGPIHYDYDDHPGTLLNENRATGADDYYNNAWYNGYAIYGLSIGTPMAVEPVRNTGGATTRYLHNRFWGIHGAIEGDFMPELSYRAMANYRRYYGNIFIPATKITGSFSAMAEVTWRPRSVAGLKVGAQLAFDAGNSVYTNNLGALVSVSYSGIFNFKTKKSTPCADLSF
ncbi:MAG: capsule assembly Wzi family protein [Bacteroides sp.]|nr:capsule assembly Wzi family protein [Bacteroides sp.]